MNAQVIPMHARTTWDDVRTEYGKMAQMGYQSVLQAVKVGAMLIELKEDTDHGEWEVNVNRALQTKAARQTAFNLMRLAAHLPLLEQHKPDSQRAALALIAERNPKPKRTAAKSAKPTQFRMSWTRVLLNYASSALSERQLTQRKNVIQKSVAYEIPAYFNDEQAARQFALDYIKTFPDEPTKPIELSETAQQKLDRATAIEKARLTGQFEKQLYAEVDKRIPEITAERQRAIRENTEETVRYAHVVKGTKKLITADEYRFLLHVLHPDRAPEDRKEQFTRAFQIVKKLRDYAEA